MKELLQKPLLPEDVWAAEHIRKIRLHVDNLKLARKIIENMQTLAEKGYSEVAWDYDPNADISRGKVEINESRKAVTIKGYYGVVYYHSIKNEGDNSGIWISADRGTRHESLIPHADDIKIGLNDIHRGILAFAKTKGIELPHQNIEPIVKDGEVLS